MEMVKTTMMTKMVMTTYEEGDDDDDDNCGSNGDDDHHDTGVGNADDGDDDGDGSDDRRDDGDESSGVTVTTTTIVMLVLVLLLLLLLLGLLILSPLPMAPSLPSTYTWPCPFASVVQGETREPKTGTKARGQACSRSLRAFLDGFSVAQWRSAYGFGADYARLVLLCDEETKTQGRRRRN